MKPGLAGERKAELRVGSLEAGEIREINGSVEASYPNIPQATSMAWIICFEGPGLSPRHGLFVLTHGRLFVWGWGLHPWHGLFVLGVKGVSTWHALFVLEGCMGLTHGLRAPSEARWEPVGDT